MEFHQGPDGSPARAPLKLTDAGDFAAWEPDPAADTDELDALAELFIGEDESNTNDAAENTPEPARVREPDRAPGSAARSNKPSVEAVITGHLPVRGAVWVRAYAASVARSEGRPIALVRVTSDRTTVELVGSLVDTDPVADIDLAIQAVSSATEHWLLHFDELDQASLLREPNLGRVTVLSGADEPAIVSAYRLLKTVSDDRDEAIAEGRLDVGVSIVGSPADETARATDRLGIAARRFLHVELGQRMAVPRVETASVSLIGELDSRCDPSALLVSIADCVAEPGVVFKEPRTIRTPRPPARETEPSRESIATDDTSRRPAETITEAKATPEIAPISGDRPLPSSVIAGLTSLELQCPVAREVELASDEDGGLHLLTWWCDAAPASLLKARVWAGINLPLLSKIGPIDAARRHAKLHVVCDEAGAVLDLRGGDVRVHLAQPASRATANGWVTTTLK